MIADYREAVDLSVPPLPPYEGTRPPFLRRSPERVQVIAEYKRQSPSRGVISTRYEPEEVAGMYERGGAVAISVLTQCQHFGGHPAYLSRMRAATRLPLLRKDFIYCERQVLDTAATPASALLLIVALTPEAKELRRLRELAESFGIQAVVEIYSRQQLDIARASGARIIQVNNRNLDTLEVDPTRAQTLIQHRQEPEIWIAASGIQDTLVPAQGYDAALVGTALMAAPSPENALRRLVQC